MGQLEVECCISSPHLLSPFLLFLWRLLARGRQNWGFRVSDLLKTCLGISWTCKQSSSRHLYPAKVMSRAAREALQLLHGSAAIAL